MPNTAHPGPGTVRTGVIGLGYWGPNLLRNLLRFRLPGEVVICDRDPMRLAAASARFPGTIATTESAEVFRNSSVEEVVLATPVRSHVQMALEALESGKHVLVEKPLATSLEGAVRLLDLAQANRLTLMAGHTFLYSPAVRAIRKYLVNGELGALHYILSTRVNLGIHQPDESVFWDLGPHDLSMILYWLGELPGTIWAYGRSSILGRPADVGALTLEFPSGTLAMCTLSWLAPTKVRRTTLVGPRKMIVYEDTDPESPVRLYDKGILGADLGQSGPEWQVSYRTGDMIAPRIDSYEPLGAEIEEFLLRCSNPAEVTDTDLQALGVVAALEAADKSLQSGGVPVAVQMPPIPPRNSIQSGKRQG